MDTEAKTTGQNNDESHNRRATLGSPNHPDTRCHQHRPEEEQEEKWGPRGGKAVRGGHAETLIQAAFSAWKVCEDFAREAEL